MMFKFLKPHLQWAFSIGIIINLLTLAPTLYMLQVYDRVLSSRSIETLIMIGIFATICIAISSLVENLRSSLLFNVSYMMDEKFGQPILFGQINEKARQSGGRIYQSGLKDVATIKGFCSSQAIVSFLDAPWFVVYMVIIFSFHWALGLSAIISVIILVAIAALNNYGIKEQIAKLEGLQKSSSFMKNELMTRFETITALGILNIATEKWAIKQDEAIRNQIFISSRSSAYKSATKFSRQFIQIIVMGIGAWLVVNKYATGGVMLATTILLGKALMPIEQMIGNWKQFSEARAAWGRLQKIIESPVGPKKILLPIPTGALSISNLTFMSKSGKMALNNVSFNVEKGDAIAILGPSAAGKSTLIRILVGLWVPRGYSGPS